MTNRTKFLLIVGLSAAFVACKKGESTTPITSSANASLVGTWRVINDTTRSAWGAAASENVSVYTGTPSDYYTFNSNGTFSWQQGSGSSSGSYSVSDKQLTFVDSNEPSGQNIRTWYMNRLTDHIAVFNVSFVTPGGATFQTITLSK